MNVRKFDLLVAGVINPDLVLSGNLMPEFDQVEKLVDSAILTTGSSSTIFAWGADSSQKSGGTEAQPKLDEACKYVP